MKSDVQLNALIRNLSKEKMLTHKSYFEISC